MNNKTIDALLRIGWCKPYPGGKPPVNTFSNSQGKYRTIAVSGNECVVTDTYVVVRVCDNMGVPSGICDFAGGDYFVLTKPFVDADKCKAVNFANCVDPAILRRVLVVFEGARVDVTLSAVANGDCIYLAGHNSQISIEAIAMGKKAV